MEPAINKVTVVTFAACPAQQTAAVDFALMEFAFVLIAIAVANFSLAVLETIEIAA